MADCDCASHFFSFIAAVILAAPSAYKSIISPGKLIIHKLITEGCELNRAVCVLCAIS